jgi:hypothetical protein
MTVRVALLHRKALIMNKINLEPYFITEIGRIFTYTHSDDTRYNLTLIAVSSRRVGIHGREENTAYFEVKRLDPVSDDSCNLAIREKYLGRGEAAVDAAYTPTDVLRIAVEYCVEQQIYSCDAEES